MAECRELAGFLERSLATLRRTTPAHHRALGRICDGLHVQVSTPDESFGVGVRAGSWRIGVTSATPEDGARVVWVETTRATVVELLRGTTTALRCLRDGTLRVRGPSSALPGLDEALRWYAHGVLRCPEHPSLFEEFTRGDDHDARQLLT